ncbi:conserved hypothetical protein [Vibrio coralliirubri]|nr:conserved hypothetical protein [Vibrio coralliirubri]
MDRAINRICCSLHRLSYNSAYHLSYAAKTLQNESQTLQPFAATPLHVQALYRSTYRPYQRLILHMPLNLFSSLLPLFNKVTDTITNIQYHGAILPFKMDVYVTNI